MLDTIGLWAKVVKRAKNSRFVFMRPEYQSEILRENILRQFVSRGLKKEQIEFWSEPSQNREHMKLYNQVDVLLDCYPMTGGIGMIEALWMGVPAVSLEGPAIQLRVGASHLHSVGLDDLRAKTQKQYIDTALALAKDTERRKELRASLRGVLAKTSFCDMDKFGKEFNQAMITVGLKHNLMKENKPVSRASLPGDF